MMLVAGDVALAGGRRGPGRTTAPRVASITTGRASVAASRTALATGRSAAAARHADVDAGDVGAGATAADTQAPLGWPFLYAGTGADAPPVLGITRSLAPRWKASYGLGPASETSLASALRFDRAAFAADVDPRENWRHFLGVEFDATRGVSFLGGIAGAGPIGGGRNARLAPSGYEKLRLSTGARWRGQDWGLDSSFSFIPTGAGRAPGDAGFFPGAGDAGPTWLLSFAVSRRF